MNELTESIDISASPEEAFRIVTDLPQMGRLSPENTGGEWLNGATGAAMGAKFKGTNANGPKSWTTTAKVVELAPSTSFAFEVTAGPAKVARWAYTVEPRPGGCRVTESWIDRRSALAKRFGAKASGREHRDEFTLDSIKTTLENLKRALEQSK
ncbi:MAG: SRPBCC family protein [Acidimicrobiales bacterium]